MGNLPSEKINKWVGCDPKADQQTCWNAVSSTFSCPAFASVLEYEFVTTTKSYLLHAPLEYFAPNSAVVSDFILWPENFTTTRGCTPGSVYSPFGEKCGDGIVNVGEACDPPGNTVVSSMGYIIDKNQKLSTVFGNCGEFEQANKTCNSVCNWSYGSCKSIYICGNDKVEGDEVCDDGALNGTYGHCAKDCGGQFTQFCGNGVRDEKDGKLLEFCDVKGFKFQKGFCDKLPVECDDSCLFFESEVGPLKEVVKDYCELKKGKYDCGQCVSKDEPTYDFVKENSCSWDCQNYGGYCGDNVVQSQYETCDDGNGVDFDGCSALCQKEDPNNNPPPPPPEKAAL